MDYEQIKQVVIDNAWGGISMDYGLLHVQLATPLLVTAIILLMIFLMNKLLFQPVLRTLENRQNIITDSQKTVSSTQARINQLRDDYEAKLQEARSKVSDSFNDARKSAQKHREELIQSARQESEAELEKGRQTLQSEIETVKENLKNVSIQLAELTSQRLLN